MEPFNQLDPSENPTFTFDAHDGVFFSSWAFSSQERISLTEEALDVMMGRVSYPFKRGVETLSRKKGV